MGRYIPKAVRGCTGPDDRWGRDREEIGKRKERERGRGKKLRGTGEGEPARYKECAAFKKGEGKREGKGKAHEASRKPIARRSPLVLFFIYLLIYFLSHPPFKPRR